MSLCHLWEWQKAKIAFTDVLSFCFSNFPWFRKQDRVVNNASFCDFFSIYIFFHLFSILWFFVHFPPHRSFLIAPSSLLLSPRRSFLLIAPSFSSLLTALFNSFRISKSRYFIKFDGRITGRRDRRTKPLLAMQGRI